MKRITKWMNKLRDGGYWATDESLYLCISGLREWFDIPHNADSVRLIITDKPQRGKYWTKVTIVRAIKPGYIFHGERLWHVFIVGADGSVECATDTIKILAAMFMDHLIILDWQQITLWVACEYKLKGTDQ